MKKKRKFKIALLVSAAAVCLAFFAAGLFGNNLLRAFVQSSSAGRDKKNISGTGILKVGVRDDVPNFSAYNQKAKKYYGMEIDIADDLCKRLGYRQAEYIAVKPKEREKALNDGDVDIVIGLYSITEERCEKVDFTEPYYTDTEYLITESSSLFETLNDMRSVRIAVHTNTPAKDDIINTLINESIYKNEYEAEKKIDFIETDSYKKMFELLETGRVDAAAADDAIAYQYMNGERKKLAPLGTARYAVASKKNSEISEPLYNVMNEMLDDGTIERIIEKWSY